MPDAPFAGSQRLFRNMGGGYVPVVAASASGGPQEAVVATIAYGASLSDAIDCGNARALQLIMPADWTAAGLTARVSYDGQDFKQLYDIFGNPYPIQAAASRVILLPIADWIGIRHFKLESVNAGTVVAAPQAAERQITVVLGA